MLPNQSQHTAAASGPSFTVGFTERALLQKATKPQNRVFKLSFDVSVNPVGFEKARARPPTTQRAFFSIARSENMHLRAHFFCWSQQKKEKNVLRLLKGKNTSKQKQKQNKRQTKQASNATKIDSARCQWRERTTRHIGHVSRGKV
jgi:hypothetical protein